MFWQLHKEDDSHEFRPIIAEIEEEPVSPLGRSTFWIITAVIFFTGIWMFVGKVDIVVSGRGEVIPDGEIKILQPLDTGVISKILAKEGDFVKKGQILMEIDPSTVQPMLQSMQTNLNHTRLEINRLKAATDGGLPILPTITIAPELAKTQKDIYSASVSSLNDQIASKKIELNKIESQINSENTEKNSSQHLLDINLAKEKRLKTVLDIIAKNQYEETLENISTYTSKINEAGYKIEELNHQKNQVLKEIAYLKENFRAENFKEISDKQKAAAQLEGQIKEASFKNTRQKITSPVNGYVVDLSAHTIGGIVTPAQKLVSIVPANSPLIIKSRILNKDIGFIKEGQPVSIKIDTFDFQKYGILKGIVKQISRNSIKDDKEGLVYEVYIKPVNSILMIEGRKQSISSGMSLTSEIKVGNRRIIEFFIYPLIKYFNEGISVR